MSKLISQLTRQMLLIRCLKENTGPVPKERVYEYIRKGCEVRSIDYPKNQKALEMLFTRDKNVVAELLGIDIEYIRPLGYFISNEVDNPTVKYDQLFEDFDLLTSLQPDDRAHPFIYPDHHRSRGNLCLSDMLCAIKSCFTVEFDYNLVRHGVKRRYTVNPCFLKENQQRWYVGALDRRELKLFSLDRISNLEIMSDSTFERPEIDVEAQWKDCYGIWDNLENPVEEIVLRYSALDGNFIKGVPLHHSQKVLSDTDEEFVISVRLRISNDFIMVLLSRSKSVEVIEPLHLRQTIRDISAACAERNK